MKFNNIENPKKRRQCDLSMWYRINENDGSTIAYCPDIITAKRISVMVEMENTLQLLFDYQNGCPLPKYENGWNEAMQKSRKILDKLNESK